jgi:hypothetical protein
MVKKNKHGDTDYTEIHGKKIKHGGTDFKFAIYRHGDHRETQSFLLLFPFYLALFPFFLCVSLCALCLRGKKIKNVAKKPA